MRARLTLMAVVVAAVSVAVIALRPFAQRPPRTLTLEARVWSNTLVEYTHPGPPPWPTGNSFRLSTDRRRQNAQAYWVANMHAENFKAVVKKLRLDNVRVLVFDDEWCLVADPRIPREWLLAAPRDDTRSAVWERVRASHADKFRGG